MLKNRSLVNDIVTLATQDIEDHIVKMEGYYVNKYKCQFFYPGLPMNKIRPIILEKDAESRNKVLNSKLILHVKKSQLTVPDIFFVLTMGGTVFHTVLTEKKTISSI